MNSTGPLLFRNQYILATSPIPQLNDWNRVTLGAYTLQTHPEVIVTQHRQGDKHLVMIGYCYDFRNPTFSQQQILDGISLEGGLENFHTQVQYFSGVYLFFFLSANSLTVVPDFVCLREVYISRQPGAETIIASSPQLISLIRPLEDAAIPFYQSPKFMGRKIWVGNGTSYKNITRLKPNHTLSLPDGTTTRFFPHAKIESQQPDAVVEKTHSILPGIIRAASLRDRNLMIGFTAGWDSRLLLASSRAISKQLTFFINRHSIDTTFDFDIPNKLAHQLDLTFIQTHFANSGVTPDHAVFHELPNVTPATYHAVQSFENLFAGFKTISGSGSEIARNEFGIIHNLTGAKLAALAKYADQSYAIDVYQQWLDNNEKLFQSMGYQTLDMFYWEESVANRVAKTVSEAHAFGRFIYPAFNCRYLITQFLTVDKKFRDKQHNILYHKLIEKEWKETLQEPINPSWKKTVIRVMQRLGLYNLYRNLFTTGILKA